MVESKNVRRVGVALVAALLVGCVGSPIHSTVTYNTLKSRIRKNNSALLSLQIGMSQQDVGKLLGGPESSEGYEWGTVWLYRTGMTSGIYGTADSDFTPVVFGANGNLVGWGRNFFAERAGKYEIEVKQSPSATGSDAQP